MGKLKHRLAYRKRPGKSALMNFLLLVWVILLINPAPLQAEVTEQDILDAILGKRTFPEAQLQEMDLNGDGKVDVADAVYFQLSIASFATAASEADENTGTHDVVVNFNKPFSGILRYTIGGTATQGEDYSALSGTVDIDGSSVSIPIPVASDTVYEGSETIVLSLLPGENYLLGEERSHILTLRDNPSASSANYLFILSSETLGVEGDTASREGFPPTLFSRTASVNITFSHSSVLDAALNVPKSIGFSDSVTGSNSIPAATVSYGSGTLELVFEYETQSESFVSTPSATNFDPAAPSFGDETKKTLVSSLTLTVNEFDILSEKFTDKFLEGTFSLRMSGVLNEGTSQFFNGRLSGTMQQ